MRTGSASPGSSSKLSTAVPAPAVEVNGMAIVEYASKFYLPDETYCGLEFGSKYRCPGHGLVPARRVSWGGESTGRRFLGCPLDLPEQCRWIVWVDPPPPACVALAFEDMHADIESIWIKCHHMQKRNLQLAQKKRALKKRLKDQEEMLRVWAMLFVLTLLCVVVVAISVSS